MEKVDELIEELADHIEKIILSGKERENEIAEKTKALAELVSARAQHPREIGADCVISAISDGVLGAVRSAIHGTGATIQY